MVESRPQFCYHYEMLTSLLLHAVRYLLRPIAYVALLLSSGPSTHAADFNYGTVDNRANLITISGTIAAGDAERFDSIQIDPSMKTVVLLYSPGGNVIEALQIGETIRRLHYHTYVPADATCASACGLIWLAGELRLISASGQVGFHAAYTLTNGVASESGVSNAIIGAYLTRLGLSYGAVAFVTSAPPGEMQWLHGTNARDHDIDVVVLDAPEQPAQTASVPGASREQQVLAFVKSYFIEASGSGSDVHRLEPLYADVVNYYGEDVPRSRVMAEKQKFAARWPLRNYTVNSPTVSVQCSEVCSASGVIAWDTSSEARGSHSTGTANVVLKLTATGPIVIVSENGGVLNRAIEPLVRPDDPAPAVSAATKTGAASQSYVDGYQARARYEAWYAKLPEGAYRDGVMWWAANRSNRPPPSCTATGATRDWLAGCTAARGTLSPVDIRRKTERDFWLGWNSP